MNALLACIKKELLLLSRDLHGLALLFIMPLAFVIIMSLALQSQMAERSGSKLKVLWQDADQSEASLDLLKAINNGNAFEFSTSKELIDDANADQKLRHGDFAFAIRVAKGFGDNLLSTPDGKQPASLTLSVAPDTSKQIEAIMVSSLHAALGRERMRSLLSTIANDTGDSTTEEFAVRYAYVSNKTTVPSSVQQSVPAWLVFGAFFVVVPLSNTLISERQQGTLRRLRSTNLGTLRLLTGKLIPYFCINQLQVILMLIAGSALVPALGGEALQINGSWLLLAIMAASLSIAALGIALLIAVSSSTTEQATLLGGTGNIVLAAIGGIMIPKFVMPTTMQSVANWSPMSWGLEGFLDILLRNGTLRDIAPEASGLFVLGLVTLLLAWFIQSRRSE
ncbi:MAG TPA: ABC transporter permease [Steroidobacteraceae bacterium]|nr:ABC transporter permease [Steroidobacteraceae bacterium]